MNTINGFMKAHKSEIRDIISDLPNIFSSHETL